MQFIAGQELWDNLQAEKRAKVPAGQYPGTFESTALCALQVAQAQRGILGVQLIESIYGWSVRYDSGIQNFGIIAGSRRGDLNGSFEAAAQFAKTWVAQDPAKRYAWMHSPSPARAAA